MMVELLTLEAKVIKTKQVSNVQQPMLNRLTVHKIDFHNMKWIKVNSMSLLDLQVMNMLKTLRN